MKHAPSKPAAMLLGVAAFAVLMTQLDQKWIDQSYIPALTTVYTSTAAKFLQEQYDNTENTNSSTNSTFIVMNFLDSRNESTAPAPAAVPPTMSGVANTTAWLGTGTNSSTNTTFSATTNISGSRNETATSEPPTVSSVSSVSSLSLRGQASANLTLVVQVAGELGNHFGYVNRGIMLARMARELAAEKNLTLHTKILLKQQGSFHGKKFVKRGAATEKTLRRCFPWFQNVSFGFGRSPEYDHLKEAQSGMPAWKYLTQGSIIQGLKSNDHGEMRHAMEVVVEGIHNMTLGRATNDNETGRNENTTATPEFLSRMIPLLDVSGMADFSWEYEEEIRDLLHLDQEKCCKDLADPDESVFHYRGFWEEMHQFGKNRGFEELSVPKISHEVFGNLKPRDKVAILSRFQKSKVVAEMKVMLEQVRGAQVRIMANNSGVEDFCLLQKAQKEVVGSIQSTFFQWATILGHASKVRVYILDRPFLRNDMRRVRSLFTKAAKLMSSSPYPGKLQFEVYQSEGLEVMLNQTGKRNPQFDRIVDQLKEEYNKTVEIH